MKPFELILSAEWNESMGEKCQALPWSNFKWKSFLDG